MATKFIFVTGGVVSSLEHLHQRGTHGYAVAHIRAQSNDGARRGSGYVHHGFIRFHRHQRLIDHHVVSHRHVPADDFRLLQAFAQVRQVQHGHVQLNSSNSCTAGTGPMPMVAGWQPAAAQATK